MWSTILLLLAGFAAGIVLTLLAQIVLLQLLAADATEDLRDALEGPALGPAFRPISPISSPHPGYPSDYDYPSDYEPLYPAPRGCRS